MIMTHVFAATGVVAMVGERGLEARGTSQYGYCFELAGRLLAFFAFSLVGLRA